MKAIQTMNKNTNEIISREFFALYSKYEKPQFSFFDAIAFIWNSIGVTPKLILTLMLTSVLIGCKFVLIKSFYYLFQKNRNNGRFLKEKNSKRRKNS